MPRSVSPKERLYTVSAGSAIDAVFPAKGTRLTIRAALLHQVAATGSMAGYQAPHLALLEDELVTVMERHQDEKNIRENFRRTIVADALPEPMRFRPGDYVEYSAWFDRHAETVKHILPKAFPIPRKHAETSKEEVPSQILSKSMLDDIRNTDLSHLDETSIPESSYPAKLEDTLSGRALFFTTDMRMGVALASVQEGDMLCIPFGAQVPWIVRQVGDDLYEFVSECYVHGIMDGEMMDQLPEGSVRHLILV